MQRTRPQRGIPAAIRELADGSVTRKKPNKDYNQQSAVNMRKLFTEDGLNITQHQLKLKTGIGQTSSSRYCNGENIPIHKRQIIASAFNLPPDWAVQPNFNPRQRRPRLQRNDSYWMDELLLNYQLQPEQRDAIKSGLRVAMKREIAEEMVKWLEANTL